jgi:anti-sigma factor RsiW
MIAACEEFAADLVAYLDGEHAERETARIEAHLGTCLNCRRELEQLRRLRALLGELRAIEPSPAFHTAMWRRLDPLPTRASRRARTLFWAAPALAAAAAVALVWYSSIVRVGAPGAAAPAPRAVAAAPRVHASGGDALAQRAVEPERGGSHDVVVAGDLAEYPPELVEHPELFLRLPVVRRLQKLQHFEEVRQHDEGEPLGQLVPGASSVG